MSDEKYAFDLVGMGKLAKAIPAKSWNLLVQTATDTFRSAVAPFTETTSGLGRWVAAKFDRLEELEKINAAAAFKAAREAIDRSGRETNPQISFKTIAGAVEGASRETDPDLQTLWGNLIAQEFVGEGVHPHFVHILGRLTPDDARTLEKLSKETNPLGFLLDRFTKSGTGLRLRITSTKRGGLRPARLRCRGWGCSRI